MPMMELTLPAGTLDTEQSATLVDELTTLMLHAERAPNNDFFRSVTWVYIHELPPSQIYSGGRAIEQAIIRLDVTTPEGALSDRRRAELIDTTSRAIRKATGISEEDGLRVWVLCHEIPEGSWGAAGQVVQFKALREAAAAARTEAVSSG